MVNKSSNVPNTFLIGAPKCGTTTIAKYLSNHPRVITSDPKEPYYWASDFPGLLKHWNLNSFEQYLTVFDSPKIASVICDCSTIYLASDKAVERILDFNSNSKFIVCIRDPVEMLISYHSQMLKTGNENEPNIIKAWKLQSARSMGNHIPVTCKEPKLLQYRSICSVGTQLKKLFSVVPQGQIHIVVLDNLRARPDEQCKSLMGFLELEHNRQLKLGRENVRTISRSQLLSSFFNRSGTQRFFRCVKGKLGIKISTKLVKIKAKILNKTQHHELSVADKAELHLELKSELCLYKGFLDIKSSN